MRKLRLLRGGLMERSRQKKRCFATKILGKEIREDWKNFCKLRAEGFCCRDCLQKDICQRSCSYLRLPKCEYCLTPEEFVWIKVLGKEKWSKRRFYF